MYNPEATVSADGDDNIRKIRDLLNWADAFVLGHLIIMVLSWAY
jgi:hypothetical protein